MSRLTGVLFIAAIVVATVFVVNRFGVGGGVGALGVKKA